MRLTAERNELAAAVAFAAQGCSPRLPVYAGILTEVREGKASFSGSDGDTTYCSSLNLDGSENGAAIFPAIFPADSPCSPGWGGHYHR